MVSSSSATSVRSPEKLRADAVLIAVTCVWGLSFVLVRNVLREAPPMAFLFWRFLLATGCAFLLLPRLRRDSGVVRDGVAVGLLLGSGMALQVLGQVETTASKAAFLTGLSVVLTPFAAYLRSRRVPSLENGIGIALASVGFLLLTFPRESWSIGRGDAFVLCAAVVFAFYVVELSERAPRHAALALTAVQMTVVAGLAGILSLLLRTPPAQLLAAAAVERRPLVLSTTFVASVLYLGSIGTVGTFFGQAWAQRRMSATHAAILFSLEPVFASILAAWLLGERLGTRGLWGAGFILAGVVVSEMRLTNAGSAGK
jgi:drug/metabolite transporter (DMT)-like permease